MLHQSCSQHVVLSNTRALTMVKALLAFHPETAHAVNAFSQLPIHVAAMTESPQAIDIMDQLIRCYPKGLLHGDHVGNTPMHIAASVNNIAGVRKLVEHSFRQAQHLHNFHTQFPMDCTMNRQVLQALVAPQSATFKTGEPLYMRLVMMLCTAMLMAANGLILMHYWLQVLSFPPGLASVPAWQRGSASRRCRRAALCHCALTLDYANPQQHRAHHDLISRINAIKQAEPRADQNAHLLYFLLVVISFGVWLLGIVFILVVRICCAQSIVKVFLLALCFLCTYSRNVHIDAHTLNM